MSDIVDAASVLGRAHAGKAELYPPGVFEDGHFMQRTGRMAARVGHPLATSGAALRTWRIWVRMCCATTRTRVAWHARRLLDLAPHGHLASMHSCTLVDVRLGCHLET
jgi:hypothetical protein